MQKEYVRSLFNDISGRYDLLNHLLSGGIDRRWRRRAIETLKDLRPRRILDVATGTADLAIAALELDPEQVVGVDIAEQMLEQGRAKLARIGAAGRITLATGEAESLPFPPGSFDAATVAFGVRNFEDLGRGLAGMHAVLRDGGRIVVLEFSRPARAPFRQLYLWYFRHVLPLIGRIVSRHPEAYTYLPDTVMRFPEGKEFLAILSGAGFTDLREERLSGGIATIYTGTKRP